MLGKSKVSARCTGLLTVLLATAGLWGLSPAALAAADTPEATPSLPVSQIKTLVPEGGRNPTVAVDHHSGEVYVAWAQQVPSTDAKGQDGKQPETRLEVWVARSEDGGQSFGPPVVASPPEHRVRSYSANPTQVAVGPKGNVYVLYTRKDLEYKVPGWPGIHNVFQLVRSIDGGQSFSAPVAVAAESVEGVPTQPGIGFLFVAPDGDVYVSFLDYRESLNYWIAHGERPPADETATQFRVARSTDGGHSFAKSTLVAEPVCGCCGTRVAQGADGPLYAGTRGLHKLKGSYDAIRDPFVAISRDNGKTWSEPVKIHDDDFKISGCPDVNFGLKVGSKGRLHAAWYTGTSSQPGVFYAYSDDEGKTFSEPVALLADDWVPYGDVNLALDAHNNAWVVFEDRRGARDLIQVARITPAGELVLSPVWPGTAPDVAAWGETAIATWYTQPVEGKTEGGAIQWRTINPGEAP